MRQLLPLQILIPGVILLLLGVGNIYVGTHKAHQYEQAYEELSKLTNDKTADILMHASPLRRIQLTRQSQSRLIQQQEKAKARQDLYQLFAAGGILFLCLGVICVLCSLWLSNCNRSRI